MEAINSSETSVLTRATPRNILEDGILQYNFTWYSEISIAHHKISLIALEHEDVKF
jgi:hypothetical protein